MTEAERFKDATLLALKVEEAKECRQPLGDGKGM